MQVVSMAEAKEHIIPPPGRFGLRGWESYVAAASVRCREEYKLDPAAAPRCEHIGGVALRRRHEEMWLLEHVGQPEMRRLSGDLAQSGYILLLTDRNGTILDICADAGNAELTEAARMLPGFLWDERHQGTNGPGTCLHDGQPRVVHRNDHFFMSNRSMTCSAAPIWGPNGQLLGALDASRLDLSDSRASQTPTIALVCMVARMIEQLYFTNLFRECLILRLRDRPDAIGLPHDALLALDAEGRIRAADSMALREFAASAPTGLAGHSITDLLEVTVEQLFEQVAAEPSAAWLVRSGTQKRYVTFLPARRQNTRGTRSLDRHVPVDRAARASSPSRPATVRRTPLIMSPSCDPVAADSVRRANLVMDRDINILLQGETGVGKDTFARAIHRASDRFDRPFVAVNCVAIPEALIESELFGYEPGAFTGARPGGMRGKVVAADGGTLFLDEIGDMPVTIQARLLRLLEEREVVPVGAVKPVPVDLKVISATHRDLQALVASGGFRMDLYYRLNGVTLTLPPLRERADLGLLIDTICREEAGTAMEIDAAARALLMQHRWPGNLRELRNTLRTAIAFAAPGRIEVSHLPAALRAPAEPVEATPTIPGPAEGAASWEYARVRAELARQHWRIGRTAAALGVSRNTLYRKMRRFGLMPS